MKKSFLLLGILILIISCAPASSGGGRLEDRVYYEGTDGVSMKLLDADSPPSRIYYYSDTEDNTFDISVEVMNTGASFSRGGIYLSGYDPNLIHVIGINPDLSSFGVCGISIGNIGFGQYGFGAVCDQARVRYGDDRGLNVGLDGLISTFLQKLGWDSAALLGEQFTIDRNPDNELFQGRINLFGNNINFEYGRRGRLMIALFAGVDFTRNFGIEYLLEGDTPEFPGGDVAIIDWDANIINFPLGLDETTQTFLFTNCHLYSTHAAPIVCIDPAPFTEGQKVCSPMTHKYDKGQGAPVAITMIEQENTPRQAIFSIHVKNVGDGQVWHPGLMEKCSPYQDTRVTSSDKNRVFLGQIRISGDAAWLQCVPNDFIRLDRDTKEGIITCRYDTPFKSLKSAYQTPLIVELWYGYETSMRKSVTIKRAI